MIKLPSNYKVLTVDAGIVGTGWCFWEDLDGVPNCFGVITSTADTWLKRAHAIADELSEIIDDNSVDHMVIEFPSTWNTTKSIASTMKGDLSKLVYLIGLFGMLSQLKCNHCSPPTLITPSEWKGQLNKEIVIGRIFRKLRIVATSHDADAIGMGLGIMGKL